MKASRPIDEHGLRKRRALRDLMKHELIPEAIADIRDDFMIGSANTRPDETEKRESYYHLLCALEALEGKLSAYIGDLAFEEDKAK